MTYDELNGDQKVELKQRILTERNEQRGEGTSYVELADADDLVSDEDARDWAEGMAFSEDDFMCSCHGRTVKVEKIPFWAVGHLVNGDHLLLESDRKLVAEFEERLKAKGLRLLGPIDGTENEFCAHPAFGLACGTVDFAAEGLRDG